MKKILLIAVLVSCMLNVGYAKDNKETKYQKKAKTEVKEDAKLKFNHWYLGFNAGIGILDGDQSQKAHKIIPANGVDFACIGQVGYMISPIWGLYLQYNYLPYEGVKDNMFRFDAISHEATLNGSFCLLDLFSPCRKYPNWNLNVNVGVGVAFYDVDAYDITTNELLTEATSTTTGSINNGYSLVLPVGLSVEYSPVKWLGICLNMEYRMHKEDDLDAISKGNSNDNTAYAGLGLKYKIGATNPSRPHVTNLSMCQYAPSKTALKAKKNAEDIADLTDKVENLTDMLNNQVVPNIAKNTDAINKMEADSDMDGVPDSRDRHANTPAGSYVNYYGEPLSKAEIEKILGNTRLGGMEAIYFDLNSTRFTSQSRIAIAQIADKMFRNPSTKLDIIGYCDNTGTEEYNNQLSIKRAESVKNELVKKYGIDANRINVIGKGKVDGPKDSYLPNRRCEFIFTK